MRRCTFPCRGLAPLLPTLALLVAMPATAGPVLVGAGNATALQSVEGKPGTWISGEAKIAGAFATSVADGGTRAVFRFQFIRPDSKAITFAVWLLPAGMLAGTFASDQPGVSLIYYEQPPGNPGQKLFLADGWSGEITVSGGKGTGGLAASFHCIARDNGPDHKPETPDDSLRQLSDAYVEFYGPGDMSAVEYYYVRDYYYDDEYYLYGGQPGVVVYDDGCTGGPDDYDDETWGSGSGGQYDGDSCDGDVYDDSGDSWGDSGSSSDDASCDYDDGGTYDDSGSGGSTSGSGGGSGGSDREDDDWDWVGDDWEDDDSDSGDSAKLHGMSWAAPIARWVRTHARRPLRMSPLLLGLLVIAGVRLAGRPSRSRRGSASPD